MDAELVPQVGSSVGIGEVSLYGIRREQTRLIAYIRDLRFLCEVYDLKGGWNEPRTGIQWIGATSHIILTQTKLGWMTQTIEETVIHGWEKQYSRRWR